MSLMTDLFIDRHACASPQLDSNTQHEVEHVKIQVIAAQISKINLEFVSDTGTDFPNHHIMLQLK